MSGADAENLCQILNVSDILTPRVFILRNDEDVRFMVTERSIVGLPDHLDLNEWIAFSLASKDEISRQIALEELVSTGVPPYLASKIKEISSEDPSTACRQIASWIERLECARNEIRPQIKSLEFTPAYVSDLAAHGELAKIFVITQLIRKSPSQKILQQWRDCVASEKNPRVLEAGLTILGKFGSPADVELVPMLLLAAEPEVLCAAFSLLQQQDVTAFKQQIRSGLTAKSITVQLHSVHLLRMVDCEEATKYIQAFLFHKNALVRQKALRELMLIDFNKVESLFLQYLGREIQPLLLVKAGFVGAFNPAIDFPLKIYNIMSLANGFKKHILQLILRQSIESIQAAGILRQTAEEYMLELRQKITQRRSEQIIRCAVADLASSDANMRVSAVERLIPYAEHASIRTILQKYLTAEADNDVRALLESILLEDKSKLTTVAGSIGAPDDFMALSFKEQRSLLSALDTDEKYQANRQIILKLLERAVKKNLLLEILKLISRFGSRIDSRSVVGFIEDKDSSVAAQAIKTIGKIDIDVILPNLNRFLADEDPRIKSAVLEVYLIADKEGAVQYLSSMLRSATVSMRRIGLSLLPQVDYPSVEPLLWRMLDCEASAELRLQAAYMVAANPTRDGLFRLFAFTHEKSGELKPGCDELWRVCMISAETVLAKLPEEIEEECWVAYKAENEKIPEDRASYAYNPSTDEDDEIVNSPPALPEDTPVEKFFLHLFEFKWHYICGIVLMIPILWYTLQKTPVQTTKRDSKKETAGQVSFISSENSVSDIKTQVDTSDWQGTLKTGARELLAGRAYSQAISSGEKECEDLKDNYEKDYLQYMNDLANNPRVSEDTRMLAAANLNPAFFRASLAWAAENYSEAEMYYEQAANDPHLNTVGRCSAMQRLMEIAESKKDKASWIKWQGLFLKEMKTMPGNDVIKGFDDFAGTFGKMLELSQSLAGGTNADAIVESLKSAGETDESARESVEALRGMNEHFNSILGSSQ